MASARASSPAPSSAAHASRNSGGPFAPSAAINASFIGSRRSGGVGGGPRSAIGSAGFGGGSRLGSNAEPEGAGGGSGFWSERSSEGSRPTSLSASRAARFVASAASTAATLARYASDARSYASSSARYSSWSEMARCTTRSFSRAARQRSARTSLASVRASARAARRAARLEDVCAEEDARSVLVSLPSLMDSGSSAQAEGEAIIAAIAPVRKLRIATGAALEIPPDVSLASGASKTSKRRASSGAPPSTRKRQVAPRANRRERTRSRRSTECASRPLARVCRRPDGTRGVRRIPRSLPSSRRRTG